jgi:hypothetical protein
MRAVAPWAFSVDLRWYRRDEALTRWEEFVHTHLPDHPIPPQKKERAASIRPRLRLARRLGLQKLHQQCRTKIDLGIAFWEAAMAESAVECPPVRPLVSRRSVGGHGARPDKDWISVLKKHRTVETQSFVLKDAAGQPLQMEGPPMAVEDLGPLIRPPPTGR